jgi:hypothetical protein
LSWFLGHIAISRNILICYSDALGVKESTTLLLTFFELTHKPYLHLIAKNASDSSCECFDSLDINRLISICCPRSQGKYIFIADADIFAQGECSANVNAL